jgi:hypothetical protein
MRLRRAGSSRNRPPYSKEPTSAGPDDHRHSIHDNLFEGADWDFSKLQRIHDACEEIARSELGLDIYPNQIEVITAEQMLDAFSSAGMPLFYKHWSFGKHFAHHEACGPAGGAVDQVRAGRREAQAVNVRFHQSLCKAPAR